MAIESKDVTAVLNDLIEICKDGEEGFRSAAEKAKEPSLKSLFSKYATQRATYAQELQSAVSQLGGEPETSGHIASSLHRGWMGLKEALSKDNDKAIIDECETGEDVAMKGYKEAVAAALPPAVQTVVQRQYAGVQEAHGTVRDLKHGTQSRSTV